MEPRGEPIADDRLMAAVAVGDHAAFVSIYRAHIDQVIAYGTSRCRDAHEVSDLTAAVFVAVWEGASNYDPDLGAVGAWINGIAARRLADQRRSDARRAKLSHRLTATTLLYGEDVEWIGDRIDAERLSPTALAAIDDLPAPQREVFRRVAVEGAVPDDVGAELGISPTAVRMRLMRARRSLRRAVEAQHVTGDTP